MDLLDVAGELYALAPQDFTAARDERARQARADGDRDMAQQVRRLSRPTAAAWVVNTLARGEGALLDELLALGASLREAQEAVGGQHVRRLSARRRKLLAAASARAASLAQEHGHAVSRATADEVEATLRSAVADATAARAVRSGRLTRALAASGLGSLDVSGAVAVPESLPAVPAPLQLVADASEPRAEPQHPEPAEAGAERTRADPSRAERSRDEQARADEARDHRRAHESMARAAAAAAAAREAAADAEAAAAARSDELRERVRAARRELHDLEQQAASAAAEVRAAREEHRRSSRDARSAERAATRAAPGGEGA